MVETGEPTRSLLQQPMLEMIVACKRMEKEMVVRVGQIPDYEGRVNKICQWITCGLGEEKKCERNTEDFSLRWENCERNKFWRELKSLFWVRSSLRYQLNFQVKIRIVMLVIRVWSPGESSGLDVHGSQTCPQPFSILSKQAPHDSANIISYLVLK